MFLVGHPCPQVRLQLSQNTHCSMLLLGASMAFSLGWSHISVVAGGSWPSFLSPSLAQCAPTSLHMSEAQASFQTQEDELQAAERSPFPTCRVVPEEEAQNRVGCIRGAEQACPGCEPSVLMRPLDGAACTLNLVGCAHTGLG